MKNIYIRPITIIFILCCMILFNNKSYSQNKETKTFVDSKFNSDLLNEANAAASKKRQIDSLNNSLLKQKPDTLKIKIYMNLIDLCEIPDNLKYTTPAIQLSDNLLTQIKDSLTRIKIFNWRWYAVKAENLYYQQVKNDPNKEQVLIRQHIELCKKYNNPIGVIDGFLYLADIYFKKGEMLQKLKTLQEGYNVTEQMNFKRGMSRFVLQTAFFYADNNDSAQVLAYLYKGELIEKEINDSTRNNRSYFLRGKLYTSIKHYNKALSNFNKAIEGYTKAKERKALPEIYFEMGKTYQQMGEFNKAISCFEKCEALCHETGDMSALAKALVAKGNVFASQKNYVKAIETHKWLYDLRNKANLDHTSIVFFGSGLAQDYFLNREYKKAKEVSDNVLKSAYAWGAAIEELRAEETAYKIDSALGNYKEAFIHYHNMINLKNLVSNDEIKKTGIKEKFKRDLEEQKSKQEKQNIIAAKEKKKQRLILFAVIGFLILVAILAGVVLKNLRQSKKTNRIIREQKNEVEKQKHLVEEKQKEIVDSISYAKRLQEAILPPQEFVNAHLTNNFIYYQPKDIVAGDFYWAEKVGDLFFIAAADSTGHGVPGAMVSVVCSNALNRTIKEFKLTETGKILDKTRELVIETFEKSASEVKDGMDISLLCIDSKNKNVNWSGANNPIWYIQDKELKEIKADKQPIGKSDYPKPFTTHQIEYKEKTIFYLFTDGFADQFGGPDGKKYKYKQFSDLLVKNHHLPQQQQAELISKSFSDWKGGLEQVDDVCVIGIRI